MANIWKQFIDLLPKPTQFIAKVITVNDNNTALVELLSGDRITVKGTGDINSMYLIENNIIVTAVPTLNIYDEIIT